MLRLGFPAAVAVISALLLTAGAATADPNPAGMKDHPFNGSVPPETRAGITTFRIEDKACSRVDYGDGRGENDCRNGNVRSALVSRNEEGLGEAVEYRFDIQIGAGFAYQGYYNPEAAGFLPDLWDSRLRIASWEGPAIKNFIYMLKLDSRRGIDFVGRTCVAADRLQDWNSFSMMVRWASDRRGWIKVTCNDQVVYLEENIATNQAPHCYVTNECDKGVQKNPRRFLFILGPVMAGFGPEWEKYGKPSQFTDIQKDGIAIKVRNVAVTKGAALYGPEDREVVRELQKHLRALECDPGPADGVAGEKTKQAALTCRTFAAGELPEALNVATARSFLELYRRHYPI
ncbi:MAG: peptidoglycan-binding protein [Rhizobiaceae bacterium]|nr:peptidoglycan-binding protein [Rhizobiaceae bacterium]